MSLTIRRAVPGDAPLVLGFVRELADYESLACEASAEMLDAALFAPNPRVFADIAEWHGQPAGLALWYVTFSSFRGRHGLYLEDLYVQPAFRRHGIGKALLTHLAAHCVREGFGRFEWAVLDWNKPSIAFYQAMGAELMDEWTVCRVSGEALQRLAARR